MVVKLKFSALRQDYWYDYAIRLVLGGLATVLAGLVADAYGPAIGGLMLGFPAIFCASATLDLTQRTKEEREERPYRRRARQASGRARRRRRRLGQLCDAVFCRMCLAPRKSRPVDKPRTASTVWIAAAAALWCLRRKARSQSLDKHKTGESTEAPGS